ncbi:MAG: hypothetical protein UY56_C0027G0003 [Parcubacteria group bacterium GW2011_GWA1_50_14]|uniref:Uncharacterized protein n=1 Tax=Candidatus Liptonbacteria bacterium GWB1_49_6 TaxID=1798644 RepID=A0A1G2C601_9BACT|nr:MAG: hypothetical protein UY56_C0027G0003 [Parcubacteria group bacterium GW2011_GWA1_50_14]OGY96825.1 MAG: hypothetical protein A2122_00060 [Candidatus Liptonbacteria bacterium GWB1_49_6]
MKIFVKAKPSAKEEHVEKVSDAEFIVSVKEPPVRGAANAAIIRALAEYFQKPVSSVRIVLGHTARRKIIEVLS